MRTISNKKVSIIVPCYNYAHYLGECLDSLMNQTYPLHEIIVVDDGGKDNPKEICDKYKNVKYLRKENGGLSSARNYGIERSMGDYIMCLDADDKLTPGAIEEHINLLEDEKTIAQCALMEFDERHVVMLPTKTTLERIMQSNTVFCNALFPKQAWIDVGGYDESEVMRAGYEDWEFWIRCLVAGYHLNTSDFIALRYRCHEGQMSQATAHPQAQKLYRYIYEKHRDLYDEKGLIVAGLIL